MARSIYRQASLARLQQCSEHLRMNTRGFQSSSHTLKSQPSTSSNPSSEHISWAVEPWQATNMLHLRRALKPHLDAGELGDYMPPGYQMVSHNETAPEGELAEDGAEWKYAPGPEWTFRVWAGANFQYLKPKIKITNHAELVLGTESFESIRYSGNPTDVDCKAFVTIAKQYNQGDSEKGEVLISEKRHLCFLKQIPESLKTPKAAKTLKPPTHTDSTYRYTMTPTPELLFRFSALSNNVHKIHYDNEYAKQVYGVPNLIVHGPLTGVLMQEALTKSFADTANAGKEYVVHEFEYKNMAPLWVNEEITVCCRLAKSQDSSSESIQLWDTWVEVTKEGGAALAVKGRAKVGVKSL
ncbi:hypothetical protein PV10_05217 [Exophiala mesophila]|uniref:Uncharacterized protein n=1 Tax=Exophiala mesophila TaxID=212818 RepID=A0A0D1WXF0_EXOME|nr:uncharacterized protein PV10_05217 [Exophiala mesophila]KIV94060.1 hypothetical protein PV10_05217 [Exophiala mesophila]